MTSHEPHAANAANKTNPPAPGAAAAFSLILITTWIFLAAMPSSVLLALLTNARPEFITPIRLLKLLVYPATLVCMIIIPVITGLPALRAHGAYSPPVRHKLLLRNSAAAYYSCSAAALLWASYMHISQSRLFCDYILSAAISVLTLSALAATLRRFAFDILAARDKLSALIKYSYIFAIFPALMAFVVCAWSPLGPMSFNLKYRAWLPHPSTRVSINSKTLRGPEFDASPLPGVRRIAILGDSSAFGLWHRYDDTLAAILSASLDLRNGPHPYYDVINAAVPTHRVRGVVQRYKQAVRPYHPSLLIIYAGHNDSRLDPKLFRSRLMFILNDARAKNIPVIIATYPHLDCTPGMHALAAEVRRMAPQLGLYLVDLEKIFNHNPRIFCANGIHPNSRGHKLIASLMYDMVLRVEKDRRWK